MHKRGKFPLTSVAGIIRGLYPAHPTKAIERALGCSPRQAQRIVETGQVPAAFCAAVAQFLRDTSEYNRRRQAEYDAEIELVEKALLAKAEARSARDVGGDP
jgi:hypothetical protein